MKEIFILIVFCIGNLIIFHAGGTVGLAGLLLVQLAFFFTISSDNN